MGRAWRAGFVRFGAELDAAVVSIDAVPAGGAIAGLLIVARRVLRWILFGMRLR